MIVLGSELPNIYLGDELTTVYLGNTQVYPNRSAQTQAVINSANANNIAIPSDIIKIDVFIKTLVNSTVWNKLDVLYLFASNDASRDVNFIRINLVNPSILGTYNGGLDFLLLGIKGNGTNAYFDTNFNPRIGTNKYKLNDASRGVIVAEVFTGGSTSAIDGTSQANTNSMLNNIGNFFRINQGNANPTYSIDMRGLGLKILNRVSKNTINTINRDILEENNFESTEIFNGTQYLLRNGGVYGNGRVGLYFMGESITLAESQIIRQAFNTYINQEIA